MELASSELTRRIIGCAMSVHRALGPGFLESVYQSALLVELADAGLRAEASKAIEVRYKGRPVGNFIADVLVEEAILIENKAVSILLKAHEVQLVHYLTATGNDIGLLLNFGAASLEYKRKFRVTKPSETPDLSL